MVSPDGSLVAMHLCDGLLKLLPVSDGFKTQAFNVRVEEFNIVDSTLLAHHDGTIVAILAQDSHGNRHLTTYTIDLAGSRLGPGPWKADNVGSSASALVPLRGGSQEGVLILGEGTRITHAGPHGSTHKTGFPGIVPSAWAVYSSGPQEWLVGDMEGGLHKLRLDAGGASSAAGGSGNDSVLDHLSMRRTGESSIATALAHLGGGLVFVGSCFGDSQSIQLPEDAAAEHEVVASYSSLSPIVDMTVMDLDRQGQCQLVTASGAYKDGSLRVVRSGIGIDEHAVVPLPGIKGMWALQKETGAEFDTYLVQSFNAETSVLAIQDEELGEVDVAGFKADVATLHCNTLQGNVLVQVTREQAVFVNADGKGGQLAQWTAPSGSSITLADSHGQALLLALDAGKLVLLSLQGDASGGATVVETATSTMPYEVAALALNRPAPLSAADGDVALAPAAPPASTLAAVSLWTDISVRLLALPSLQELAQEKLAGTIQARSVKLAQMEERQVLFAGMGDGALVTFEVGAGASGASPVALVDKKRTVVGTQPIVLNTFESAEGTHVFVACDRPTVVYSSHGKLNFNNVNVNDVTLMCPYSSEDFPDCLALANEEELTIGMVDDIQKLHVRSIPLGESPRRLVALPHASAVAVGTLGEPLEMDDAVEKSFVHLFDDSTFERVASYQLKDYEQVQSMAQVQLGHDDASAKPYLAVGTAFLVDGEEEPRKGRLLVFSITGADDSRAFLLEAMKVVDGGAMALTQVRNNLVAAVNSRVMVFKAAEPVASAAAGVVSSSAAGDVAVDEDDVQLQVGSGGGQGESTTSLVLTQECVFHGNVFVLALSAMGDFILVGDLMKSCALLLYLADEGTLQETARDPSCQWLTAQAMQDDQVFLAAESSHNLLSLRRNAGSTSAFEASRLDVAGEFHLGQQVNRIVKGSLVMRPSSDSADGPDSTAPAAAAGAGTSSAEPPTGKRRRAADGSMMAGTGGEVAIASAARPQFIYGTVEGSIGVVLALTKELYTYLLRVQLAMATVVSGVGKLDHGTWRSYYSEGFAVPVPLTQSNFGFVDGDFLELFLQLPVGTQQEVVAAVNELPVPEHIPEGDSSKHPSGTDDGPATHKELLLTLEELSRLH